jgi:rfaE bifunctional protein nucleotidyltransferase chain/domain
MNAKKKHGKNSGKPDARIQLLQNRGNVVYLPGVFDLFHVGHLLAIQKARKFGEVLIVGVQSDRSVYRQKKRWPVINVEDRKKILFNIKGVDWVISYEHPDQTAVLEVLKPDFLAVNEDYGKQDPDQKKTLRAAKHLGVKVVRVTYTHGISTTSIREKIKWTLTTKK